MFSKQGRSKPRFDWLNPREFETALALTSPLLRLIVLSRRVRQCGRAGSVLRTGML